MFGINLRRVTAPGTTTINGRTERFAVGRLIDATRYDVATLDAAGITTVAL